ncbi:hypothetical protein [Motiliproteus sp. MSK22-1]|uniref:hypothetical protein n=1 Tax=Motiliproteus sp. MSK22-1 TaxID=1897630 RepID=UPI0009767665|nr:hypothetical protein [Motiliproteus sp. MSK22-1]OMH32098.1 hypothetical protein BGP75_15455 [Motiliproteus sp. MSK22-1]
MGRALLSLLIIFTLLASGCAHRRFINAGDDYLSLGKYQQAIDQYQQASYEKPGDAKTQEKLYQAKALFDDWLDDVAEAARQAEQNQLFGKAQLLYAKLAEHRQKLKNRKIASQLRQQNIDDFGLRIKLDISQPQLYPSLGQQFNNINLIDKYDDKRGNEVYLSFSLAKINFITQKYVKIESKQYIDSYNRILNPEYRDIQQDILDLREETKNLRGKLERQEQRKTEQQQQLLLLEKDWKIALLTNQNQTENTSSYYSKRKILSEIKNKSLKLQQEISDAGSRISRRKRDIAENERELDDLFYDLHDIPELVDIPVYADYQYPVETVTQIAKSHLEITICKGADSKFYRQQDVQIKNIDKSHPSHSLIALKADPLLLKNDSELTKMLNKKVQEEIIYVINNEINQYQQTLITQAHNEYDPRLQLDQWLIAGIISKQGLPGHIRNIVRHQLSEELGQGGVFNINDLLN